MAESQTAIEQSRRQQDDVRAAIQETRGQVASLVRCRKRHLTIASKRPLSHWMQAGEFESEGTVYASLDVDAGWEAAIEQVLGDALSARLLSEVDLRGLPEVEALPSGAFVADNKVQLSGDVTGTLAAHVRGPARVRVWLQSILVAESLDEAQRLCRDLSVGQSVVTPDGHWLGAGWHRRRSDADAAAGMIAREAQLDELKG